MAPRTSTVDKKLISGAACGLAMVCAVFVLLFTVVDEYDPLVGPVVWATGVRRETSLGTYLVFQAADFKGGDVSFSEVNSLDECLYECNNRDDCSYFTYLPPQCYLKAAPKRFVQYLNRPTLYTGKRVFAKPLLANWGSGVEKETEHGVYRVWTNQAFEGPALSIDDTDHPLTLTACLGICDAHSECLFVTHRTTTPPETAFADALGHCTLMSDSSRHSKVDTRSEGYAVSAMKAKMNAAPDPLVKHHWTSGGVRQTHEFVYQTWARCQFRGDHIVTVHAPSLQACLQECDAELYCEHVTLVKQDCMLNGFGVTAFEILPNDTTNVWAAKRLSPTPERSQSGHEEDSPSSGQVRDLHAHPVVGEYYDEGDLISTPTHRYRLWHQFRFEGGDLDGATAHARLTLDGCLRACDDTPGCQFVVASPGKDCALKGSPTKLSREVGDDVTILAAMKLGEVGKRGIDSATKRKHNNRDSRTNLQSFMRTHQMPRTRFGGGPRTQRLRTVGTYAVLGTALVLGLMLAVHHRQSSRRSFADELL